MFMMGRVRPALALANLASQAACFERAAQHLDIGPGAPRGHRTGRPADVGAIEIETDALAQILNLVFRQASVRTGNAGLRAIETMFYTGQERTIQIVTHMGMRGDHLLNMHVSSAKRFLVGSMG
jgi:hypothetical protein